MVVGRPPARAESGPTGGEAASTRIRLWRRINELLAEMGGDVQASLRAAVTLGLTGRYAVQSAQARAGLELWADAEGGTLTVLDDEGEAARAAALYDELLGGGFDVLLGPYASGLVRQVAPVVCGAGRLLWNHGGAADDLVRPLLVTVVAPAATYLHGPLRLARRLGATRAVVVQGTGVFAREVAKGALAADARVDVRLVDRANWRPEAVLAEPTAIMVAGTFDEDVEAVSAVRNAGIEAVLVACVAAGIGAFGDRLGEQADGVVGPAQWFPRQSSPHDGEDAEVGASAAAFATQFRERFGRDPDYPAAQAAAAGFLAAEAVRRGYGTEEVGSWRTSTLLGRFALDAAWRQTGYAPVTVRWRGGIRELVDI